MFADILEAIDEATEDDGDVTRAFQLARAQSIGKFMKFSGMSQADAATEIGVSPAAIQKMITQPGPLAKHLVSFTTMLSLPKNSISTAKALTSFAKENRVFASTLDAVITYTPAKYLPMGMMPTDYVIAEVKRNLSERHQDRCTRLVAYFTAPAKENEPNLDDMAALEESLEVPVGAIQNPAELAATKTKVSKLSYATRKKISANIKRIATERRLDYSDIASKAGVPLISILSLREKPYNCTLALVVALASALEVEPYQLMQDHIKSEVEEPLQPNLFEDLPKVPREFILNYVTSIRDKREGLPTTKASAVLMATPLLQHAIGLLSTYSSQGSDEDNPRNLGDLVNQMVASLRVGL